jgi:hypothetical protein
MSPPWLSKALEPIMLRGQEPDAPPAPVPDAEVLLSAVAAALTACDAAGYSVELKAGAVMTRVGYVLPLGDGKWAARTLNWSPFSSPPPDDLDD